MNTYFKIVRRTCFIAALFVLLSVYFGGLPSFALANSPSSTPTTQASSPQETLSQMDDGRFAGMKLDQAMVYYSFHNDGERDMAKLMAQQAIATAKLEESARKKWGDPAKADVAHACMDNTPADDAKATWTVKGDHAIAQFGAAGISPLFLVQEDGRWKADVSNYVAGLGAQLPQGLKYMKASISVLDAAEDRLTNGQGFSSSDEFVKYLQGELNKLNTGN